MIDKVVRDYSADIVNFVTVVPLLQGHRSVVFFGYNGFLNQ
jgi:hypothetical protein